MTEDKKINTEYRLLLNKLDESDAQILRDVQKSWLNWRTERCDDIDEKSNCDNGVCAGVAHDSCILKVTRERTAELTKFRGNIGSARMQKFSFSKNYENFIK